MPDSIPERNTTHHDVFISYAQEDKLVADAVCAKLESKHIRCWIAPRDVPPGTDFPAAIIEGIDEGRVIVVIFSSHANRSPHVIRELTNGVNKGRIIIPFRIEDVAPTKSMEYLISVPHWLDAVTPPLEQHIDTLITTIRRIIGPEEVPPPPPENLLPVDEEPPEIPSRSAPPAPDQPDGSEETGPALPPPAQKATFRLSPVLLAAGIVAVALIIAVLAFQAGFFTPSPPPVAVADKNTTLSSQAAISDADYYQSTEARVDTVVLTTRPTQTLAKDTELYIDVTKDNTKAVVTVQFNGGPGIGLVRDNRVILTRSDGSETTGKLNLKERLSSVQLQGSRGTDRLQVVITLHSGERRVIIDKLLPYRQYR
ncbi:MAG: toll/interleukin-1 receptor domain-containing protein [Methanomicrobiales archaeon]|nr:toll/interleukin-1 receptor domain-containing protein [Methanomicrobiales archaeon]